MAITLATGSSVSVAATYGVKKNMTAISNANPAVATLEASHGILVGDIFEVSSGWDLLDKKIVRASVVAVNDVTLEAINTSDLDAYPAGTGVGSVREITAWNSITQVQGIETSGGEINFADITTIADQTQKQIPTTRSPQQINLTVFDDPALAWYSVVSAASDSKTVTGMRIIFPDGSRLLANGYFSLQKTPTITINAPLTSVVGFSAAAEAVRYTT